MLKALAQRDPMKVTKRQLATLAGLSPGGGTYSTYLSRLRTTGMLEEDGGMIKCSAAGLAAADVVPAQPQNTGELVAMWRSNVGAAGKLLDVLVADYLKWVTREDLAAEVQLEASGGTFSTYLSRLKSNGLVDVDRHMVRASESLF